MLATEPDLPLLDEPLAALDASTHAEVRRELRGHLADFGGATIALYAAPPTGSPRNVSRTTVADIDHSLDRVRVTLGAPLPLSAELTTAGLATLQCHLSDEVWASVKATEIVTYPA